MLTRAHAIIYKGIACSDISQQGWGALTSITLPRGGKLGVYQPRHASPPRSAVTVRVPDRVRP